MMELKNVYLQQLAWSLEQMSDLSFCIFVCEQFRLAKQNITMSVIYFTVDYFWIRFK
jgi:hypothetical protein